MHGAQKVPHIDRWSESHLMNIFDLETLLSGTLLDVQEPYSLQESVDTSKDFRIQFMFWVLMLMHSLCTRVEAVGE